MWRKEWYMMFSAGGVWLMAFAWFVIALFLLGSVEEYQAIAIELASLNNRRGATQMILLPASAVVKWLIILWSVYFGARSIALERQWQTDSLYLGRFNILVAKASSLLLAMALISLPFWLFVAFMSQATDWDNGLLGAIALGQGVIILYAALLSLVVSATQRQALSGSLFVALLWSLLWVLPLLATEPPALSAMLRWLSPFEHVALLEQGLLSVQTLIFIVVHLLFFITLIPVYWVKDR